MANPRRFTDLIVPLLSQSKRRKYVKGKTTEMMGNKCLLMDWLENVINKLWILPKLLDPQHLGGIWVGKDQYRLPLAPLNDFPEPWC